MSSAIDRPDVSVVVSTYNHAHVMPHALESLLDQDHDPATDGTRRTIESFAAKAPNLRYVFEAKQGLPHGRNAGIRAARAPLIAFTDDDVRVSKSFFSSGSLRTTPAA